MPAQAAELRYMVALVIKQAQQEEDRDNQVIGSRSGIMEFNFGPEYPGKSVFCQENNLQRCNVHTE